MPHKLQFAQRQGELHGGLVRSVASQVDVPEVAAHLGGLHGVQGVSMLT